MNNNKKSFKTAIMGIRGIPDCYGGFEIFAEETSTRLVKKGHNVTLCRCSIIIKYKENNNRGKRAF